MKAFFIIPLLFFVSCGQELSSTRAKRAQTREFNSVTCSCSENVNPVCGFNGQQYVTFINACIAQCNNYDYSSGACPPDLGTQCNQNSDQVCGLPPCPNNVNCEAPRLYSDECALRNSGASPIDLSQCSASSL